ncbi:MAG: hypothetical protein ACYC1D_02400 [Acidimicrobiales bacterium]
MQTVRGPLSADQLGTTLMQEHVFVPTPDLLAPGGRRAPITMLVDNPRRYFSTVGAY